MAAVQKFDLIVMGSGAGLEVAAAAARAGLKTAVIEKGRLGGTCLNRGCIPSKMLIHSADVIEILNRASKFGIGISGFRADFSRIINRSNHAVDTESSQIERALLRSKNPRLFRGECAFAGKKLVKIGGKFLSASKILIAVGSRPSIPDIPGLENSHFITSTEALRLKKLPKALTIIGGGYIAAELAHFYGSLGAKIHIVHRHALLLNREDGEISARFTEIAKEKYSVHTNSEPVRVSKKGGKFKVLIKNLKNGKMKNLKSDALLIAVGITPNSDTLNLNLAGVKVDKRGHVATNKFMETNVAGIYAIGDAAGHYFFRHSANLEAECASANIIGGRKVPINYSAMPHAVFASPQIASVGLTEEQLKETGADYAVGTEEYINTAKGMAIEDKTGFAKFLADRHSGKILGCHIIGTDASTLIHEAIVAMRSGKGGLENITNAVHVHPALSEVVVRAALRVK